VSAEAPLLSVERLSKDYPGVRALDGVDFSLYEREVHALVGQNGAGKSTLIKILSGAQQKDSGRLLLRGEPVEIRSPQQAIAMGIATIYQELNLVPHLSAAENIFLGREPRTRFGLLDTKRMREEAATLLERLGATQTPVTVPVGKLSMAEQQMVEIAKALSAQVRILIMDEPTSTLNEREVITLFEQVKRLKQSGVSVIYISHRLEEVFQVADRVTVLRDGRVTGGGRVEDLSKRDLISLMVGRHLEEAGAETSEAKGEMALSVRGLRSGERLQGVDLEVRCGEVVGVAGLIGAGQTELALTLFGARRRLGGEVRVFGEAVHFRSPSEAIARGIGLIPEDRKSQGLVLEMAVMHNLSLAGLRAISPLGVIRGRAERQMYDRYVSDLSLVSPHPLQLAKRLSGGNQQKLVLAKWLATRSRILIFQEPTRGVDVAAKVEIHNLIRQLAAQGSALLVISSDLPELLTISHRILVMRKGRIVGELERAGASQEEILHLATGGE